MPAFEDAGEVASLRAAIELTLAKYGSDAARIAAARELLTIIESTADPAERRSAIERTFHVQRVREPLLLTAYYEPEIAARREPDETYRWPVYGRPSDLVDADPSSLDPSCHCRHVAGRLDGTRLVSYPTRAQIDAGALANRGLEIAWTNDPVALFQLQVQGSGWLRLPDGQRLGVRFAGTNGRPFLGLGRILISRGLLPPTGATMPVIRQALEGVPDDQREALLEENERYVFFRLSDGPPLGSLGVELTPGRAIATDPHLVPLGSIAYLVTPSVRRFVVSQDTGAAIVGPHADLFLGAGEDAELRAGTMHEHGTLYVLTSR